MPYLLNDQIDFLKSYVLHAYGFVFEISLPLTEEDNKISDQVEVVAHTNYMKCSEILQESS